MSECRVRRGFKARASVHARIVKGDDRLGRPPPKAGLTACLLTSRLGSTHSAAEILRWLAPLRNAVGGDARDSMLLWATSLEVDLRGVVLEALGESYRG